MTAVHTTNHEEAKPETPESPDAGPGGRGPSPLLTQNEQRFHPFLTFFSYELPRVAASLVDLCAAIH
jgi:cytochrome c biogenesis factor